MTEDTSSIMHALGRIEAKIDTQAADIAELKVRVTRLEDAESEWRGQVKGAKWVIEVLKMLPVAAVAAILGKELK